MVAQSYSTSAEVEHLPPRWNPTPPRPSLPVGVAILSVLVAISGAVIVISAILILANAFFGFVVPTSLLILSAVDPIGAGILLIVGVVLIGVATALWRQETWALWTTVVVLFFGLAYLFFTAYFTVLFVVLLVLFIYLIAVRHHFY